MDSLSVSRMQPEQITWNRIWKEFLLILDLSVFMIVSAYVFCLMFPISMIYAGRMGTVYLDAVGLGNTVFNVFGLLILNGAMTGCDTTMSQSYGTRNKKMVGVYYQKGLLLYGGMALICIAVILNSESLLVAMGQHREVARLAGGYVSVLSAALNGYVFYWLTIRYFRAQNIIWIAIVVGICNVLLSLLGHHVFITVLGFGIEGSAYAQVISYWMAAIFTLILTPCQRKAVRKTWDGFSTDSLQDWSKFSSLSLAGIFIICLQWWGLEICTLLAGTLGKVELAAQSILFQTNYFIYTVPLSVGMSCNILIGHHVGENKPQIAKINMRIGWIFTWVLCAVNVILLLSLSNLLSKLFTTDAEVLEMTSENIKYLAIYHVFESTATASLGMCRGIARQKMGSFVSFIGYYVIGMPIALSLTFVLDYGLKGLWIGLSVGLAFESVLILVLLNRTDWPAECRAAQVRAGLDPDQAQVARAEPVEVINDDDKTASLIGVEVEGGRPFRKRFNSEAFTSQTDVWVLKTSGVRLTTGQMVVYRGGFYLVCVGCLLIGLLLHFLLKMPYELVELCLPVNGTGNATVSPYATLKPCTV